MFLSDFFFQCFYAEYFFQIFLNNLFFPKFREHQKQLHPDTVLSLSHTDGVVEPGMEHVLG